MISKFNNFINENSNNDLDFFIENIFINNVPTSEIMELKKDLENIPIIEGYLNENVKYHINKLKYKYGKWFNDKLFKWLIDRKKDFYNELIYKLNIFDLSTLDDIIKNYPGFKLNSMYLAGGMDEAEDTGKGWRNRLEYEFENYYENIKNPKLPEIDLYGELKIPSYVIDGIYLDYFLKNPKKTLNYYSKPALLNPVRKEIDRTMDDTFDTMIKDIKDINYDPVKNIKPFNWFRKTFTSTIEPDDEHLLRISDAVFLGQDKTAGAGTYGELQLLSLIRKPLFAWLVNESKGNVGKFKLWNIPHLSKVARTEDEMTQLVNTIINFNN